MKNSKILQLQQKLIEQNEEFNSYLELTNALKQCTVLENVKDSLIYIFELVIASS